MDAVLVLVALLIVWLFTRSQNDQSATPESKAAMDTGAAAAAAGAFGAPADANYPASLNIPGIGPVTVSGQDALQSLGIPVDANGNIPADYAPPSYAPDGAPYDPAYPGSGIELPLSSPRQY